MLGFGAGLHSSSTKAVKMNFCSDAHYIISINFKVTSPVATAMPKLNNVPIKIYSVNFRPLDSFRSPKRKTDFAANKKPMPSQLSVATKGCT